MDNKITRLFILLLAFIGWITIMDLGGGDEKKVEAAE